MTKNLRENEAGHISVGATWMFYLPPNTSSFNLRGTCPHQCIEALTDEDYEMNIFAHSSHSHAYAKSSKKKLFFEYSGILKKKTSRCGF